MSTDAAHPLLVRKERVMDRTLLTQRDFPHSAPTAGMDSLLWF